MGISDRIELFITELLKENGEAELKRNELASVFECVPSQINYVISTRFTPERGYTVESKRGGGGYIRIMRLRSSPSSIIEGIGDSISRADAKAVAAYLVSSGAVSEDAGRVLDAALSDEAIRLPNPDAARLRASILKQVLISIG